MRQLIFFLIGCLLSTSVWAASVTQVKGNKVLLQLDGESLSPGNQIFIVNSAGKKIGLVTIKAVKGSKALGQITKGRANVGDQIQAKSGSNHSEAANNSSRESRSRRPGRHVGGVLVGYAMDSMSLTAQSTLNTAKKESLTMTGTSFSVKGFYDYSLSPSIVVRGAAGLEGFSTKGSTSIAICDNEGTTNCEVSFNYLSFEGSAHYNFLTGNTKAWVGLGYEILYAMSKKNNIPNLSTDNATNQSILVGAGVDWGLSGGSFIPFVVEYGMFPGSSNVTASSINLRSGYGFSF